MEPKDHPDPKGPRKPGRPKGSVSLSRDVEEQIVGLIRGGVSYSNACVARGFSARTAREWRAHGEKRRGPPSPRLEAFILKVHEAEAFADAKAEAALLSKSPSGHLKRSDARRAREASDESAKLGVAEPDQVALKARIREIESRLVIERFTSDTSYTIRCPELECPCLLHRERTPEEQSRLERMSR